MKERIGKGAWLPSCLFLVGAKSLGWGRGHGPGFPAAVSTGGGAGRGFLSAPAESPFDPGSASTLGAVTVDRGSGGGGGGGGGGTAPVVEPPR